MLKENRHTVLCFVVLLKERVQIENGESQISAYARRYSISLIVRRLTSQLEIV